jgi:hypothetical protein
MIDLKSTLTVKTELETTFSDISSKTANFSRDLVTITLLDTSDHIYVGFHKPINSFYFNHNTVDLTEATMTLEFYNGSEWVACSDLADDTLGLKRSGFVNFNRVQLNQVVNAVDGLSKYWYKITISAGVTDLVISGINLVFADDYSLLLEQPYVTMPEFLDTQLSHILIHAACRNEIIQYFRNKDYYKIDAQGVKQDINAWDLLEIEEVKQSAVFLAMSKIYFNMSDTNDDIWAVKANDYRERSLKMLQVASLSVDFNDNGLSDAPEQKMAKLNSTYMSR